MKLRARSPEPFDAPAFDAIDALLAPGGRVVDYRDPARNVWKRLWMRDGRLVAARVSGEPTATTALEDALAGDGAVLPAALVAPARKRAPERIVCLCLRVSETRIRAAVACGADLPSLQGTLKCGTGCGSCVTELRRLCAEPGAFSVAA